MSFSGQIPRRSIGPRVPLPHNFGELGVNVESSNDDDARMTYGFLRVYWHQVRLIVTPTQTIRISTVVGLLEPPVVQSRPSRPGISTEHIQDVIVICPRHTEHRLMLLQVSGPRLNDATLGEDWF